ncbi:sex determination protein fruitless isoform X1 [Rhynchophorus ferrugineus]|uniref:sex determination protein fruitless isoform X1 n=1 Tax=Rhynchophorus ferrugineus TaxID=354439 RepID=UPI003FCE539F
MDSQQYCLRWNNHLKNLTDVLTDFLRDQVLCDVTLASHGQVFQAHQIVLSACSPYFETLFLQTPNKHPIVFLKDVSPNEVKALLDFMYKGEVNVSQNLLPAFLKTAESLQIRGLSDSNNLNSQSDDREMMENRPPPPRREREVQRPGRDSPALKKKRTASNNNCDNTSNSLDRNSDSQVFVPDSPVDRDRGRSDRDSGGAPVKQELHVKQEPHIKQEPHVKQELHDSNNPVDSYHSMSEALQTTTSNPFLPPSTSWGRHLEPPGSPYSDRECTTLALLTTASKDRHLTLRQYLDSPTGDVAMSEPSARCPGTGIEMTNMQVMPSFYRVPLPVPPEISGKNTSQECSVIQTVTKATTAPTSGIGFRPQVGRKGSRFRHSWLESYIWLQYDEQQNIMFCKFCRKWSGDMPDIRTSFAEGSTNFRLEIVNHHDKCKAHRLCVAREYHSETVVRSKMSTTGCFNESDSSAKQS